jgi:hypothetical protein
VTAWRSAIGIPPRVIVMGPFVSSKAYEFSHPLPEVPNRDFALGPILPIVSGAIPLRENGVSVE